MSRDLDPDLATEVQAPRLTPIFMAEFNFDSGDVRFWNGYGILNHDGTEYTGSGTLLNATEVSETQDTQAQGIKYTLSGINDNIVSLALTERYTGRPCALYFSCLDADGVIVGEPYQVFSGFMDVMEIRETGQTSEISVAAENKLVDLKKAKVGRYTPEDQKRRYPDDKGLDFVPATQDRELIWGRKSPN